MFVFKVRSTKLNLFLSGKNLATPMYLSENYPHTQKISANNPSTRKIFNENYPTELLISAYYLLCYGLSKSLHSSLSQLDYSALEQCSLLRITCVGKP